MNWSEAGQATVWAFFALFALGGMKLVAEKTDRRFKRSREAKKTDSVSAKVQRCGYTYIGQKPDLPIDTSDCAEESYFGVRGAA